jgi:uncharacterized protein DUF1236
VNEIRKC